MTFFHYLPLSCLQLICVWLRFVWSRFVRSGSGIWRKCVDCWKASCRSTERKTTGIAPHLRGWKVPQNPRRAHTPITVHLYPYSVTANFPHSRFSPLPNRIAQPINFPCRLSETCGIAQIPNNSQDLATVWQKHVVSCWMLFGWWFRRVKMLII